MFGFISGGFFVYGVYRRIILFLFVFDNWWLGGIVVENMIVKDVLFVVNILGEEFYRVIFWEEFFVFIKVNYKIKFFV